MICLKNRTFAVSQTTDKSAISAEVCCDLLEKSYFCSIANNSQTISKMPTSVVICLKNRTFAVSQTTRKRTKSFTLALWFAWKIVLLQYRKQLSNILVRLDLRCDLLEKSYFCSIANNIEPMQRPIVEVVICLKNRTFAVSQTTVAKALADERGCDLLEKSYFCSIANNWWPYRHITR